MAKSLFSNNNTDITDKYRIRNEEALRKERAQSIDKQSKSFRTRKAARIGQTK